jgi:aspartyl-tRNA(Asn)/glutamyl-tRNA(Gln) amidotransferase subunit B
MAESGASARDVVAREGLVQITDEDALQLVVEKIVADNPQQRDQYRAGKSKLLGFFVGRIMKETRGRANPEVVNRLLASILGDPDGDPPA